MDEFMMRAIGTYRSSQAHPYEAARQPREDSELLGEIELREGENFEQALTGVEGLERIWLLFRFDRNENWKPMVRPPRGRSQKIGVFATRAPYRPNPLGLSCVRLVEVRGRKLVVKGADLLDGTPIFDIKPYVPDVDSFPGSKVGWLDGVDRLRWNLAWSAAAEERVQWLESAGVLALRAFAEQQLEYEPFDEDRKRVEALNDPTSFVLSYRTWRLLFAVVDEQKLEIRDIFSGYSGDDLREPSDRWGDKDVHRRFKAAFGVEGLPR